MFYYRRFGELAPTLCEALQLICPFVLTYRPKQLRQPARLTQTARIMQGLRHVWPFFDGLNCRG